jgi:hypothetical protein
MLDIDGQPVDVLVTGAELAQQGTWWRNRLAPIGLGAGTVVLVIAQPAEVWTGALVSSAFEVGATVGFVDVYAYETSRFLLFLKRLRPSLIVGLTSEMAEASRGESAYQGCTVLARPEAHAALDSAGIAAGVVTALGPAAAVALPDEALLSFDSHHVTVRIREGRVELGRNGEWLRTGMLGEVPEPGQLRLHGSRQ